MLRFPGSPASTRLSAVWLEQEQEAAEVINLSPAPSVQLRWFSVFSFTPRSFLLARFSSRFSFLLQISHLNVPLLFPMLFS